MMNFVNQRIENQELKSTQNFDIAIVGMSCRFPGAEDYQSFWSNLINGVSSVTEVPENRWDPDIYYSPDFAEPGKSVSKWGGFLEDIDHFDNRFFKISSKEAKAMEPQQRLLLEETWKCVEDSGISLSALNRRVTSVYVGVIAMSYYQSAWGSSAATDSFSAVGNYCSILSNRLSYYFGFRGSSMTLDTACSSALVAMDAARRSLCLGESDYSIVAAVNLSYSPHKYISLSKSRLLSPDGKCKTFDKDANGYVPGEGVGALLLQPLEQAIEDGHSIFGVFKGSASNHVGHSVALTAPKVETHAQLLLDAYENAGISPETVNYIEAYSTGTTIGDPIEIEALSRAFQRHTSKKKYCTIGSAKANIGHLEAASGIASIIKVLMMLKHKKIPPTLNINHVNPMIDFSDSPFCLALQEAEWESVHFNPRRAGISAVGFGGVNAHVVLEEYRESSERVERKQRLMELKAGERNKNRIFMLSAKSETSLKKQLDQWRNYALSEAFENYSLDEICHTLMEGREIFQYRFALLVSDKNWLKKALLNEEIFNYVFSPNLISCQTQPNRELVLKIGNLEEVDLSAFSSLYKRNAAFQKSIDLCKTLISEVICMDISQKSQDFGKNYKKLYGFSALYSLVNTILDSNVTPNMICGEGVGQWVALAISGIMTVRDCLRGILDPSYLGELEMKRPKYALYLQSQNITIHPFLFQNEYAETLLEEIETSDDLIAHYIQKANLLLVNQFTFKKLISEWDSQLLNSDGKGLDELLRNDKWWEKSDQNTQRDKALILIIILSSLRTLNQKWDLTEKLPQLPLAIHELLDLISDQMITADEIIQFFRSGSKKRESLMAKLHDRQFSLDGSKPYKLLREQNNELYEMENHKDWFHSIGEGELSSSQFDLSLNVNIGRLLNRGRKENSLDLDLDEKVEPQLTELLLELWLRGTNVNWKRYSPIPVTRKASALPLYSFDRKRFWAKEDMVLYRHAELPSVEKKKNPEKPICNFTMPRTIDIDSSKRFVCPFQLHRDWMIQDHRITGFHIIPDALKVELVLEAFRQSKEQVNQITDMVIWKPGIIQTRSAVIVSLEKGDGHFEIIDQTGLLCSGQARLQWEQQQEPISLEPYKLTEEIEPSKIYDFFANIGYHYGEGLHVIKNVWQGANSTLVELNSIKPVEGALSSFDPCLLDGIFQSALWVGESVRKIFTVNSLFVPYRIKNLEIHAPLKNACHVLIEHNDLYTEDLDFVLDIKAFDESGQLLLKLEGMLLKRIFPEMLQSTNPDKVSTPQTDSNQLQLFSPTWIPSPAGTVEEKNPEGKEISLIFPDQGGVGLYFSKMLGKNGINPILVHYGESYEKIDSRQFCVDPTNEDDFLRLFHDLALSTSKSEAPTPLNVYYFASFDAIKKSELTADGIRKKHEGNIYPFTCLSNGIKKNSNFEQVNIIIPTMNCFITDHHDQGEGFMNGSLSGLGRVLELENRNIQVKQVDFLSGDQLSIRQVCELILREQNNSQEEKEIAIRGTERRIKKILPLPTMIEEPKEQALRADGVYLITGGLNEVGLELAKKMSKRFCGTLILVDQGELTEPAKTQIREIEQTGCRVEYCQSDIHILSDIQLVVQQVRKRHKRLTGVIHAGRNGGEQAVHSNQLKNFHQKASPWTLGTWNLDKATEDEELDFFIVFSSIISITGSCGQAEYAAAYGFLDHFIHYRRQQGGKGRSIGINWAPWNKGNPAIENLAKKRLELLGMKPIESAQGIKAIERILTGTLDQVIVLGDRSDSVNWEQVSLNYNSRNMFDAPQMRQIENFFQ